MALQALAAADAMKARANSGEIISTVLLWELQQKGARMMATLKKAGHRGGSIKLGHSHCSKTCQPWPCRPNHF